MYSTHKCNMHSNIAYSTYYTSKITNSWSLQKIIWNFTYAQERCRCSKWRIVWWSQGGWSSSHRNFCDCFFRGRHCCCPSTKQSAVSITGYLLFNFLTLCVCVCVYHCTSLFMHKAICYSLNNYIGWVCCVHVHRRLSSYILILQPVQQQHSSILDDNGSSLSDVSQASFKVPSVNDSASTSSNDHTVPRKKSKKRLQPENGRYVIYRSVFIIKYFTDGVDFSPPMMSSGSSSSSDGSHSHRRHPSRGLLGMHCIYIIIWPYEWKTA